MEENMGNDNPAYGQPPYDQLKLNVAVLPEPVLQPEDGGFRNPSMDPGGQFQTKDNANGRSDNFCPDLPFGGATGTQSEV